MSWRREIQREIVSRYLPKTDEEQSEWYATVPVRPLGHREGKYYFTTPSGQLRGVTPSELEKNFGLESLFEGELDWLYSHLRIVECIDDRIPRVVGIAKNAAVFWLIDTCHEEGLFDQHTSVRGLGVWRYSNTVGRDTVLVHCGDQLLLQEGPNKSELLRPGSRHDGNIYAAQHSTPRPAEVPASSEEGRQLVKALSAWEFADVFNNRDLGVQVIAGWIGVALLGEAPEWRPHVFVAGETGSGKSTLAELVATILGKGGCMLSNDFSEPGLRQLMTGEARALVLDEAEGNERPERLQAVIALMRKMSGRRGAMTYLGTKGGTPKTFTMNGCVYMTAILAGNLKPQDRNRITIARLAPLSGRGSPQERTNVVREHLRWAKIISPLFRARAIEGFQRFEDTFDIYRAALLEAGATPRQSDQLGALLAGYDLLAEDDIPDEEYAKKRVRQFRPLLDEMTEDEATGNESVECWQHLLAQRVIEHGLRTRSTSIGDLLRAALAAPGRNDATDMLRHEGIRVRKNRSGRPEVHVANKYPGLERLFADSRWQRSGWKDALAYLPGAYRSGPINFGNGIRQRTTFIPPEFWPTDPDAQKGVDEPDA